MSYECEQTTEISVGTPHDATISDYCTACIIHSTLHHESTTRHDPQIRHVRSHSLISSTAVAMTSALRAPSAAQQHTYQQPHAANDWLRYLRSLDIIDLQKYALDTHRKTHPMAKRTKRDRYYQRGIILRSGSNPRCGAG